MTSASPEDQPDSKTAYESRQLERVAARWNAKAERWDRDLTDPSCHLNEDQAYDRFLDQLVSIVEARRAFCASHGIIDAGCATGLVLAKVIASFAWGMGIDISPEMIRSAQAKHIAAATFTVGDCFQLSTSCPKAGAVVSRGVLLSHYGHQQGLDLLRSARAALVQHGFILWDFLNQAGRARSQHAPENKTYFQPAEIRELALAAGFRTPTVLGAPERRIRLLFAEGE